MTTAPADTQMRRPRRRRWWHWPLAGCAVLLLGALGTGAVFLCFTGARQHDAVRRLEAMGVPLDPAKLAKPAIPASRNAAVVYGQAFNAIDLSTADEEFAGDVSAGKLSLEVGWVAAQASDLFERNRRALVLLHRASAMPECDFGVNPMVPSPAPTHFAGLRQSSRLLRFESAVFSHVNRPDDAVAACAVNVRLANAAEEPYLIAELVRYAIIAIASRALEETLAESQPSERACRSLAAEIARMDLAASYVETMKGECAVGYATQARLAPPSRPGRLLARLTQSDPQSYLAMMADVIEEAPLAYRETIALHPEALEGEEPGLQLPTRVFARMLVPLYIKVKSKRDQSIATLDLDHLALLLKAYKARHGQYPDSLADLAKYAGYALPTDPFSGQPYVYKPTGDGFHIYSWGPNLKDDGGTPPPKGKYDEGDLVFRCSR